MVLAGQVYTSYMLDSQDSLLSSENLLEVEFLIYRTRCLNQILNPAQGSGLDD